MTAQTTITDSQIRALRTEAAEAGDFEQVEICNVVLEGAALPESQVREAAGRTWTRAEARAECERVIRGAQAQGKGAHHE